VGDENDIVFGHRCILAARCAYFEAYFRSFTPKERKITLNIGDKIPSRSASMSLIRFIYYDDTSILPEDALYLFSASNFFQFQNLRLHVYCKQALEANVSKSNVFDILEAADRIHEKEMKNFALKIIRNNFIELSNSKRLRELSKELLLDIISDIGSLFGRIAQSPGGSSVFFNSSYQSSNPIIAQTMPITTSSLKSSQYQNNSTNHRLNNLIVQHNKSSPNILQNQMSTNNNSHSTSDTNEDFKY
jgi:hypothetical protein